MKIQLTFIFILAALACLAQKKEDYRVYNRLLTVTPGSDAPVIHLSDADNDGIAWVRGAQFENGTIELDIRGKDVLQRSFVGVAFHGVNDSTFDCIYFRPFNFKAADPVRKSHAVQYVSVPKYDWSRLRTEFPGKYEKPLADPPEANGWFHVRVLVTGKVIKVFVNSEAAPSLVIEQIMPLQGSSIGLWVGNGSDGDFRNLKISR